MKMLIIFLAENCQESSHRFFTRLLFKEFLNYLLLKIATNSDKKHKETISLKNFTFDH